MQHQQRQRRTGTRRVTCPATGNAPKRLSQCLSGCAKERYLRGVLQHSLDGSVLRDEGKGRLDPDPLHLHQRQKKQCRKNKVENRKTRCSCPSAAANKRGDEGTPGSPDNIQLPWGCHESPELHMTQSSSPRSCCRIGGPSRSRDNAEGKGGIDLRDTQRCCRWTTHPGDVVDAVSRQCQDITELRWRDISLTRPKERKRGGGGGGGFLE